MIENFDPTQEYGLSIARYMGKKKEDSLFRDVAIQAAKEHVPEEFISRVEVVQQRAHLEELTQPVYYVGWYYRPINL